MNRKNDQYTPRERVNPELLEQLLREDGGGTAPQQPPVRQSAARPYHHAVRRARQNAPSDSQQDSCGRCASTPLSGYSLAMVYAPCQEFTELYEAEEGFSRGTIFSQLDKPFLPGCCPERR